MPPCLCTDELCSCVRRACVMTRQVQEVVDKAPKLPGDIQWHFIGHLQSNKVKKLVKGGCSCGHIVSAAHVAACQCVHRC